MVNDCQSSMRAGCLRHLRKDVKANAVGAQIIGREGADNFGGAQVTGCVWGWSSGPP